MSSDIIHAWALCLAGYGNFPHHNQKTESEQIFIFLPENVLCCSRFGKNTICVRSYCQNAYNQAEVTDGKTN